MNKIITKNDNEADFYKKSQENFVRGNRVYILGPFDKSISAKVIPDFNDLIDMLAGVKNAEIEIYINSCGGYASELLGLLTCIDIAKSANIKIKTYNIGYAYSCGSLLAVVGDERYMYKYASNLPHLGQVPLFPQTFEQLERGVKHVNDWFSSIVDIYLHHTKLSKNKLTKILSDDCCLLNATDCLTYGFCDQII